jgi:hypothetical protein
MNVDKVPKEVADLSVRLTHSDGEGKSRRSESAPPI